MNNKIIRIALSTLLFISFTLGCAENNNQYNLTDDISKVTFDIQYHRGGRNNRPENTLYSYLYAIEQGATTIECDMVYINDGLIVMSHDPYFMPECTHNSDGEFISTDSLLDMRTMTLEEIKSYDIAQMDKNSEYYQIHGITQIVPEQAYVPTIDEFFSLVKEYGNGIQINIESKSFPDIEEDYHACIQVDPVKYMTLFNQKVLEYGLENQIILQSFDWQTLVEMKEINPNIKLCALWEEQPQYGRFEEILRYNEEGASPYLAGLDIDDFKGDAVKAAASIGVDIVSPYYKEVTLDMIQEAHTLGMKIIPWTVNTLEDMEIMYMMGVDGFITDNGPLAREVILNYGETLLEQKSIKESKYHLD